MVKRKEFDNKDFDEESNGPHKKDPKIQRILTPLQQDAEIAVEKALKIMQDIEKGPGSAWYDNPFAMLKLWKTESSYVIAGLRNAGKSTLLSMLRDDNRLTQFRPYQRIRSGELQIGIVKMRAFDLDLDGVVTSSEVFIDYCKKARALIYVVDASDRAKMLDSKKVFDELLAKGIISRVPILVLANKVDIQNSASYNDLVRLFVTMKQFSEVFMCRFLDKAGYFEGFEWLSNF